MKITMYELLGLVKDDKAPEKVKYQDEVLYYDQDLKDYYNDRGYHSLFASVNSVLHDEVEIIEEKKIPEKLDLQYKDISKGIKFEEQILMYCDNLQFKINEIIDYINNKGDE